MNEPQARKTGSLVVRRPAFDSQDFKPILVDLFEHCVAADHNLTSNWAEAVDRKEVTH